MAMRPQIKRMIDRWRKDAARGGVYLRTACKEADRVEWIHFEDDARALQHMGATKVRLKATELSAVRRFMSRYC